jgi:hypothetical protein
MMPQQINVVPFDTDKRVEEKNYRAFNALWARYLRARADMTVAKSDKAIDSALDAQADAMWAIIDAPAETYYQLDHKFELMRNLVDPRDGIWTDDRLTRLLESIREDVNDLAQR